jgi:para-nitrobenzyl esterase
VSFSGPFLRLTIMALMSTLRAGPTQAAELASSVVNTTSGAIRGMETAGYRVFLGIPYAAPPVDALRWVAPQPVLPWSGVRDAEKPGGYCAQTVAPDTASPENEDCLNLDVVIPNTVLERTAPKRLPVMVWIYGGGFRGGASRDYDATRLAVTGQVMMVTINYRVNALGFYGLPGLKNSGDFGLLDQQAALKWVRANAAEFGGDPKNITLFGESAGAMSVCAQLVAPGAQGLFDKAIIQSGSCIQSWRKGLIYPKAPPYEEFVPATEVTALGVEVAAKLGCKGENTLECMRKIPAADLIRAWPTSRPTYGGEALPINPAKALADGAFRAVPLIWGGTRDEWRPIAGLFAKTEPFTAELYHDLIVDSFGARAEAVERLYSPAELGSPAYAWAAVATDSVWSCPTQASVHFARRRAAPVYVYEFADRGAPNPAFSVPGDFNVGAGHTLELAYLFDLAGRRAALRPDQDVLSRTMMLYWTHFAATGDPNAPTLPTWAPMAGPADRHGLVLAPGERGIRNVDLWAEHHCDFWAKTP